jgi:hypothetical protein
MPIGSTVPQKQALDCSAACAAGCEGSFAAAAAAAQAALEVGRRSHKQGCCAYMSACLN